MIRKITSSMHFRSTQLFRSSLRLFASKTGETLPSTGLNNCEIPIIDYDDPDHIPLPVYPTKLNEPLTLKKQRLLYQSRKRGMLENDLILSTFAAKHLDSFNEKQTTMYDRLINGPTNDWDIYYWVTGIKSIPEQYQNEIMDLLIKHVKNAEKEKRIRQPDL